LPSAMEPGSIQKLRSIRYLPSLLLDLPTQATAPKAWRHNRGRGPEVPAVSASIPANAF
jgi:hypothetical protein